MQKEVVVDTERGSDVERGSGSAERGSSRCRKR